MNDPLPKSWQKLIQDTESQKEKVKLCDECGQPTKITFTSKGPSADVHFKESGQPCYAGWKDGTYRMDTTEASVYLGMTYQMLLKYISAGRLKATKPMFTLPGGITIQAKQWMVTKEDADEFIQQRYKDRIVNTEQ